MPHYGSDIRYFCNRCQETTADTIEVPETFWSGDNADERFTQDQVEVTCGNCFAEYMLDVQNSDGTITATAIGEPDVSVRCSNAYILGPDEYDLDLPDEPGMIILQTLADVREVLKMASREFYAGTVNRMAFIQQFAALEAYLSDTLIGQVLERPDVLARALKGIDELKRVTLPLSAIVDDPDIVKRTVSSHLRDLLYHNFAKVSSIWRVTLEFQMFPDKDVQARMFAAVPIRHDCVHRNGKDKDGKERSEVTAAFVRQVGEDMREMVRHIESEIQKIV